MNYHRVMLHDYYWAMRLGQIAGHEFSPQLRSRVCAAVEFLYQHHDPFSGMVPNYGSNDGVLVLPLNSCGFRDYRPVLGTGYYLFESARVFPAGPWEEDPLWLWGPSAISSGPTDVPLRSYAADDGGYYTQRSSNTLAAIRCTTYKHRPGQADMLHLDLWQRGLNLACDPGSYYYFGNASWNKAFVSTRFHNTVSVDGLDQMDRGPRFVWLNWTRSQVIRCVSSETGCLQYFEGEHYGYQRLARPVIHRRAVLAFADLGWVVVDDVTGEGQHEYLLHWLLADRPAEWDENRKWVQLETPAGRLDIRIWQLAPETQDCLFRVVRGTEKTVPEGWH